MAWSNGARSGGAGKPSEPFSAEVPRPFEAEKLNMESTCASTAAIFLVRRQTIPTGGPVLLLFHYGVTSLESRQENVWNHQFHRHFPRIIMKS